MFRLNKKRPRFSVGGHTSFEHDDSSNHSGLGIPDYEDDSLSQQQTTSISSSDQNYFAQFAPDRPRRAHKSITKLPNEDNTNLNACLDHLLRILSRKDKEGFFQYPVTDQFAPGYSQIITRPMDFSTMRKKINQDDYSNLLEFRSDFELMCENAMKYNRPDTVYWQAAKKLLATGTKLMNKEKLISFRRSLECFSRLTERELGFRIDASNHSFDEQPTTINSNEQADSSTNDNDNLSSISISQACSQRKPKLILKLPKYYDKPPVTIPEQQQHQQQPVQEEEQIEEEDELIPPEEILSQAQQARQIAHEKLNLRRPISYCTLAYQRMNSKTSLHFNNQNDYSTQTSSINDLSYLSASANENNKRDYFENGPFSSNASQYDTPFSSISKEELELLIHTYGSEFSAQYAVSLMDYVKDAGDLALAYVDRFLSVLTNGEHDNFIMKRREQNQKVEENEQKPVETETTDAIPSSAEIKLEPQINTDDTDQYQQIDTKPYEQPPNDPINEYELAEKALFGFNDIPQMSNGPEQLISSDPIHHNLGIINNNDSSLSSFDTL